MKKTKKHEYLCHSLSEHWALPAKTELKAIEIAYNHDSMYGSLPEYFLITKGKTILKTITVENGKMSWEVYNED